MNFDELKNILATTSQDDWIIDDESGSFTYKKDLNLHIQRADYDADRKFFEPWATKHHDPKAVVVEYIVKYGAAVVDRRMLVSVDGRRATLPMPKAVDDLRVSSSEVNFARIINLRTDDPVGEYLRHSNIKVVDE